MSAPTAIAATTAMTDHPCLYLADDAALWGAADRALLSE